MSDYVTSSRTENNIYMIHYINASSKLFEHYICIFLPVSCLFVRSCNEDMGTL